MTATSVEIANTPEDYRAFLRVTRGRTGWARFIPMVAGAVIGIGLVVLINMPALAEWANKSFVLGVGAGFLVWAALCVFVSRLTLQRSFDPDGMYREKTRFTLSDDGIHVDSASLRSIVNWSAVRDVVVTDSHVFVMYDRAIGMIVPRRCFAFPADADGFADAVRSHLGKGK